LDLQGRDIAMHVLCSSYLLLEKGIFCPVFAPRALGLIDTIVTFRTAVPILLISALEMGPRDALLFVSSPLFCLLAFFARRRTSLFIFAACCLCVARAAVHVLACEYPTPLALTSYSHTDGGSTFIIVHGDVEEA
jgi:hypothetical protein